MNEDEWWYDIMSVGKQQPNMHYSQALCLKEKKGTYSAIVRQYIWRKTAHDMHRSLTIFEGQEQMNMHYSQALWLKSNS